MADTAGVGSDDDTGGDTDGDIDDADGFLVRRNTLGTASQGTTCTPRWADRPLPRLAPQTRRV